MGDPIAKALAQYQAIANTALSAQKDAYKKLNIVNKPIDPIVHPLPTAIAWKAIESLQDYRLLKFARRQWRENWRQMLFFRFGRRREGKQLYQIKELLKKDDEPTDLVKSNRDAAKAYLMLLATKDYIKAELMPDIQLNTGMYVTSRGFRRLMWGKKKRGRKGKGRRFRLGRLRKRHFRKLRRPHRFGRKGRGMKRRVRGGRIHKRRRARRMRGGRRRH